MDVFETFKARERAELVQGRKALTEHIFGQVAMGETDRQRLVVSGLAYLNSLERTSVEANEIRSDSQRSDGDRDFTAPAKSS